ncbi:hypothetical protein F511_06509 [Dorcoceras hygrometricum]|uniref:RING-type domain-containing protein n=1 Tax=Dorcoceras hygrometricum TaxID=472368 RepID=A0A2Z7D3P7_9LAMI|nr:hypothetical protein F511_06509 [Dorcoceras hygrometricum]
MGAVCCVAAKAETRRNGSVYVTAKNGTVTNGSPNQHIWRQVRHSPSWSFRRENRGRVAGEEASTMSSRDGGCSNDKQELKSFSTGETAFGCEEGNSLNSSQSLACQKPNVSKENTDQSISQKPVESKGSTDYPSAPSVSSPPTLLLSSQSHLHPPNSTPSRCHHNSPDHHLSQQASDTQIPECKLQEFSLSEKTPSLQPSALANDSTRGSSDISSDSASIPASSELMKSRRERWSFDSETSSISLGKVIRSSGRNSKFPSFDLQTCGICARLLTERSAWGWNNTKIISTNELTVVSVLTCGHVFHAECLDCMTPEIHKFDPICPVCTHGEKHTLKIFENAMKAALDLKALKLSRKCLAESSPNCDFVLAHNKSTGAEGRFLKSSSSSSMRSSLGMSFFKRHFSFGSKGGVSLLENHSPKIKGASWSRSTKN